ncbi:hypothetical protein J8J27_23800, partial [Mycobacterium tuberculosis]|nr:hypothetical protein [Mycobacterium tuberculosis]
FSERLAEAGIRPYLRDIERLTRQRVFVIPVPEGVDYAAVKAAVPTSELVEEPRRDDRRGRPADGRGRRDGHAGHASHGHAHHQRGDAPRPARNGPAATVAQSLGQRDAAPRGDRRPEQGKG